MKTFLKILSLTCALIAYSGCRTPSIEKEKEVREVFKTDTVTRVEIRERIDTIKVPAIKDSAKADQVTPDKVSVKKETKRGKVAIDYYPKQEKFVWNVEPDDVFDIDRDTNKTTAVNNSHEKLQQEKETKVFKKEESWWQRFKSNVFYMTLAVLLILALCFYIFYRFKK